MTKKLLGVTKEFLENEGYLNIQEIGDLGYCALHGMIYTVGVFISLDKYGPTKGRICFEHYVQARDFLEGWDGKKASVPAAGVDGVTAHKFINLK